MTLGILETIGYTEQHAVQRIDLFVAQPHSWLVDIRYSPRCRWNAQWNQQALRIKYGRQYIHLPCFGNVNYNKPGQPIQLANPDKQLSSMVQHLLDGRSFLLLCACKDYERCHRKVVYELVMLAVQKRIAEVSHVD